MKKGLNILGVFLSFLVIIVLLGLEFLLGLKVPVNKTMEVESLSEIMEKIDIERIFRDENGKEKPMGTRIYNYFDKIGLAREEVDKVVKDKRFKVIIGNYLGTMFMHRVDKTEVIYPTQSALVDFIHQNYNSFQHVTDFPKDYKQEKIEEIVSDNYGNVKKELDELSKDIKFDEIKELATIEEILSTKTILVVGGIVLCIVLLIIFRHSFYKWLKWASFPTIINGVIFVCIGLLGTSFLKDRIDYGQYDFILEPIISKIAENITIFGAIALGVGILMVIIHHFIKKFDRKKPTVEIPSEPVEEETPEVPEEPEGEENEEVE